MNIGRILEALKGQFVGSQKYRKVVQFGFLTLVIWIGIEFSIFVRQLETDMPASARPPGVEAFLPISALISLKYWITAGIFNRIHPSALVILLIILSIGLLLKKGFCGWICPIGLLSEYLVGVNRFIFTKQISLNRWIDYLLMSFKYLLLLFFMWSIFIGMDANLLVLFIYSPYNRVADIKMLKFFSNMSQTTFIVLAALILLSVIVPYFWCRYLCPYGALLGAVSIFSPVKIHRNIDNCIDCRRCTRDCPSSIAVHDKKSIISTECHSCYQCVDSCPKKGTLSMSVLSKGGIISARIYALILAVIFLAGTLSARGLGLWQNGISVREYRFHIKHLDTPLYYHNRGKVPHYDPGRFDFTKPDKSSRY